MRLQDRRFPRLLEHLQPRPTAPNTYAIGGYSRPAEARRDREWLRRFIAAPDRMNAAGDPIGVALRAEYQQARMPNLALSDERPVHVEQGPDTPTSAELVAIIDACIRIQQALHADTTERIPDDARAIVRSSSAGAVCVANVSGCCSADTAARTGTTATSYCSRASQVPALNGTDYTAAGTSRRPR